MSGFLWNEPPRGENGHKPGEFSEVTPTPPTIPELSPAVGAHHVDRKWLLDNEWQIECDECMDFLIFGSEARAEAERLLHNWARHHGREPHT